MLGIDNTQENVPLIACIQNVQLGWLGQEMQRLYQQEKSQLYGELLHLTLVVVVGASEGGDELM